MTSFAEQQAEARKATIIQMAMDGYNIEGACEIERDAMISEGSANGAYVQAWVWVDFAGTPLDKG